MFTSKNNFKNILAVICVAGAFLCSNALAGWTVWNNNGGDGKWENAANWHMGVPDISSDAPIIGHLDTAGPVLADTGDYTFDYMRVGVEPGYDVGTLNVDGANLTCVGTARTGFGYDSGRIGTLNLSSGSLIFTSVKPEIGGNKGSGMIYQTGGLLSLRVDAETTMGLGSTGGLGIYNFTAGILECRRRAYIIGSGTTFHVDGYDASSSIKFGGTADDGDGALKFYSGVTLSLSLDGGTTQGTTLINIGLGSDGAANANDGIATFESGSLLALDFKSSAKSGTWTVLTAEGGIVDSGLTLAAGVNDDPNIQWSFVVAGNDLKVTAVVVPEGTVVNIR